MLVGDRFVFLHMPKTAGSFVHRELVAEIPGLREIRGGRGKNHPGWEAIPPAAGGLPVLCFLRNPWDWYVSWFAYMQRLAPDNEIFATAFGGGRNDFATTVRRACTGELDHHNPRIVERIRTTGADFYTARFRELVGPGLTSERLTLGRYEALVADLVGFLGRAGVAVGDGFAARLDAAGRANAGRHRPYREYYDDELRGLVGEACRDIVARFGYRF